MITIDDKRERSVDGINLNSIGETFAYGDDFYLVTDRSLKSGRQCVSLGGSGTGGFLDSFPDFDDCVPIDITITITKRGK